MRMILTAALYLLVTGVGMAQPTVLVQTNEAGMLAPDPNQELVGLAGPVRLNLIVLDGDSRKNLASAPSIDIRIWDLTDEAMGGKKILVYTGQRMTTEVFNLAGGDVRYLTASLPAGRYEVQCRVIAANTNNNYTIHWGFLRLTNSPSTAYLQSNLQFGHGNATSTPAYVELYIGATLFTGVFSAAGLKLYGPSASGDGVGIPSNIINGVSNHYDEATGTLYLNVSNCQSLAFGVTNREPGAYVVGCTILIGTNDTAGSGGTSPFTTQTYATAIVPAYTPSSANTNAHTESTIAGGTGNRLTGAGNTSFIGGGAENENNAATTYASILGGYFNKIHSTASGSGMSIIGLQNTMGGGNVSGSSVIGRYCAASGTVATATAMGHGAVAMHNFVFVWSDNPAYAFPPSDAQKFKSTSTNQFLIRASGGVGMGTNHPNSQLHVMGAVTLGEIVSTPATFAAGGMLYAKTGEVYTLDGAGNETRLSTHIDGRHVALSHNVYTGEGTIVDLIELASSVAALTGNTNILTTYTIPRRSWHGEQRALAAARIEAIDEWDALRELAIKESATNDTVSIPDVRDRPPQYQPRPEPDFIRIATSRVERVVR